MIIMITFELKLRYGRINFKIEDSPLPAKTSDLIFRVTLNTLDTEILKLYNHSEIFFLVVVEYTYTHNYSIIFFL